MDDRSKIMLSALIGAAAGAVWGFLYLTAGGQRVRAQLEPKLDDFVVELRRMRGTVEKARAAADEGWRSLSDLTSGQEQRGFGDNVSH